MLPEALPPCVYHTTTYLTTLLKPAIEPTVKELTFEVRDTYHGILGFQPESFEWFTIENLDNSLIVLGNRQLPK